MVSGLSQLQHHSNTTISRGWDFAGDIKHSPHLLLEDKDHFNMKNIWSRRLAQRGLLISPFCQGISTISVYLDEAVCISVSGAGRVAWVSALCCRKINGILFPRPVLCVPREVLVPLGGLLGVRLIGRRNGEDAGS